VKHIYDEYLRMPAAASMQYLVCCEALKSISATSILRLHPFDNTFTLVNDNCPLSAPSDDPFAVHV
jgi:hypothetical protein